MRRYLSTFPSRLSGFELGTLEVEKHTVFALSTQLELIYFNPGYFEFSAHNGGEPRLTKRFPLGSSVLDAISGELKSFYEERFKRVLETRTPWQHEYTCNGPNVCRLFHQGVFPLKNADGLVLINSLMIEEPMSCQAIDVCPPLEEKYLQETGLLTQCSNCRRTLRNDDSAVWDWVPSWVANMPDYTSHSICPPCNDYYWKAA